MRPAPAYASASISGPSCQPGSWFTRSFSRGIASSYALSRTYSRASVARTVVRRDRPGLVVPFFGTVAEQKQRVRFGDLVGRRRGHLRRPLSSRLTRAGRAGRTGGSEWNGHAKRRNEGCDLHTPELFHKS